MPAKKTYLMRKILYITNGISGSGGLERVLSVKASFLADEHSYEVHIVSLNQGNKKPFFRFSHKIKFHAIKTGANSIQYFLSYKKGLQQLVNKIQPDIISVCDDGLKGLLLPKLVKADAKWIYERHASLNLNYKKELPAFFFKCAVLLLADSFDRVILLTDSNRHEWPGLKTDVIPNPVSFTSDNVSSLEHKRVIAVGSHSPNKGYDLLFKVWKNIEPRFPDWQLAIYGKQDKKGVITVLAEDMNLKNVQFFDPVKNIKNEYLKSSILVLPSRSEGFGMVLIEAMECGVPCVSFDCPSGPRDIIADGRDGYLVEAENIILFEMKLAELIQNVDLRLEFGLRAKENVKKYSSTHIMRLWKELFISLHN